MGFQVGKWRWSWTRSMGESVYFQRWNTCIRRRAGIWGGHWYTKGSEVESGNMGCQQLWVVTYSTKLQLSWGKPQLLNPSPGVVWEMGLSNKLIIRPGRSQWGPIVKNNYPKGERYHGACQQHRRSKDYMGSRMLGNAQKILRRQFARSWLERIQIIIV